MALPETEHLKLEQAGGVLQVILDRAEVSNALNTGTVNELGATFDAIENDRAVRAVVLRGAGKHFCAGADLKSVGSEHGADRRAAVIEFNRGFGELLAKIDAAPQAVIAVVQGAALGGGFGLLCVSDIAIVTRAAKTGMPETRLGLPAAQILPFVVARIGATQARYIAMRGARFDGAEAKRIGVAHELVDDLDAANQRLDTLLADVLACAPGANAVTKQIIADCRSRAPAELVASGASRFADCLLGDEGQEGTRAFGEKRKPDWAPR